ncbi:hypothetical protein JYU34_003362 [Plutella xylostella]|uniref:Uncharacterized protein n=1 Tax=Plutella xylostella TaxID=51655 RepID=A0ABQ7QZV9_PLUXY|nr:hypothetical protein JYU34_003362 [Plutella xylostella]
MVRCFLLSWQGMVWAGLSLALWAAAARAGAARPAGGRYDTATPHSPPYRPYKYIPLQSSYDRYSPDNFASPTEADLSPGGGGGMAPSELILTALRTALDIVRKVNASRRTTSNVAAKNNTAVAVRRRNSTAVVSGRGMDYYDDHDHDHDHHPEPTTTARPARPRYTDPWAGYYDWIINEGSFKFWSVFQIFTAALLLYACLSAIYYAKFNPIIPDYDREYDDYFLERTVGRQARSLDSWELPSGSSWINPRTFQFILDAISKHYENYED